jgi:hypothetical protein
VVDAAPTVTTPIITGTAQEGQTLTATAAAANDSDATVAYQWQQNISGTWTNISGATGLSYTVTEANEGRTLRVVATSSDPDGAGTTATSVATAAVTDISPTLTVSGGTGGREPKNTNLAANVTNVETGATITYQWQYSTNNTSWTAITGATNSTYKVAPALANDFFRVVVAYTDDEGTQTLTSADAAEPPVLTVKNATANETATSIPLSITDTTVDNDDTLLPVTISGVPTNWTLSDSLSAPTNLGNGTWTVAPDALASLVILPPAGGFNQGTVVLTVTASNLDTDGTETETLSTSSSLTVTIHPGSTPIRGPNDPSFISSNDALGNATIGDGGRLELGAGASPDILFAGSNGMLAIDRSQNFTGHIAGFGDQDGIDLSDIDFGSNATLGYMANAANSGGMLTVTDGVHTSNLALLGQYAASSFAMVSDGHGGTLITEPPSSQQSLLTQPHA